MTQVSKEQIREHDGGAGFAGTLRNIQLTDIIQMCCLAGASLCIRVNQDTYHGTIYIQEGEVVHAKFGEMAGINAFFAILGWQSGRFETLDANKITHPTIKEPCQFLLMEAARLADEQAHEAAVENQRRVAVGFVHKIKVLIVDDSPIMLKILASMLAADPSIQVVGSARNGEEALQMMKQLKPDLITMDVNMPVMDGSTALKHIMIESPNPVLIMSNLGSSSYTKILTFLNLGAVDFMSKPVKHKNILLQQQKMVERVHIAAKAKVKRFKRLRKPPLSADQFIKIAPDATCKKLVIMNSGVGGYLEMVNVITNLPGITQAGFLSLQSIPPHFASALATFLNARSRFDVQPLTSSAPLWAGRCYIGTSGMELTFSKNASFLTLMARKAQPIENKDTNGFDRFLDRAMHLYHGNIVVILISGADLGSMKGLRKLRALGGQIIAPKLASCILPATLEPAVDEDGLITELFDPLNIGETLKRFC